MVVDLDQTVTALRTFVLAMLLRPEVQVRAREQLDRVIGPDRLPELEDQESLPYITAIVREVLRYVLGLKEFNCIANSTVRWHPVLPLGSFSPSLLHDNL